MPGKEYVAFLSHFKVEAGSEARYLHDMLTNILGQPNFLDSNSLHDLRSLFAHVHASPALILRDLSYVAALTLQAALTYV